VGVHHRLGLQARTELPARRLGGVLGRALAELLRLDRPTYHRIVLGVSAEAPHGVIAVGAARQCPAARSGPPRVHSPRGWPLLRPGLDPALGEQLSVQRVTDRSVNLLDVALPDVRDHIVSRVVPPVLGHGRLDRVLDPQPANPDQLGQNEPHRGPVDTQTRTVRPFPQARFATTHPR
jgi:hypothetical protein